MLSDDDELDHSVAVDGIPVAGESGLAEHEVAELVGRGCGIPEPCLGELFLRACLLEEVGHVAVVLEVDDALGADDVFGPVAGYEAVEAVEVEGEAAEIDHCLYAILFGFALAVVMVVMMSVFMFMFVLMFMLVVFVMVMMVVFMFMLMVFMLMVVILVDGLLELADPGSGCSSFLEVEGALPEEKLGVDIGIVALDDLGAGLDGADDAADMSELVGGDFRRLVEEDDVAELDLLDDEVFDILFADIAAEGVAAAELAPEAEGVDDGHDASIFFVNLQQ